MRRILLDHARSKSSEKRGGGAINLSLEDDVTAAEDPKSVDLIALDEALDRLAAIDEQQARIVELKYFSGLSLKDVTKIIVLFGLFYQNFRVYIDGLFSPPIRHHPRRYGLVSILRDLCVFAP